MRNKRPKSHRNRNNQNMKENLFRILLIILIVLAGIFLPRLIHRGSSLLVQSIAVPDGQKPEKPETEEEGMYSTGSGAEEAESEAPPATAVPENGPEANTSQTDPDQARESETETEASAGEPMPDASGMISVGAPDGDSTNPAGSKPGPGTPSGTPDGSTPSGHPEEEYSTGASMAKTRAAAVSNGNNVTQEGVSILPDDVVMSGPEIQIPPSGTAEIVNTDGMNQEQINEAQADANFVASFSPRIILATASFEEDLLGTGDADGQVFLKRLGTYVVDTFGNWASVPTVEIRERISGSKELGSANYRIKLYVENEFGETEEHFAIVTYYPDISDYSVYHADTQE